jgi:glycosyltransferase involved in cell wall biosynthesis
MEIAIKSIILLVETHKLSNLKLMLVGPETEYYEDLKRKYADKDYILFPGAAISPTDWVPLFDIGILPSFFPSESCPSSIVEYLSCGKPAIASAIGEIPNMIRHNNLLGGIIVKEKDELGQPSAEFFASAILSYYNDKNKLQSDSTTALLAFEKFLIEKSAKEYITVFKDVILNNN